MGRHTKTSSLFIRHCLKVRLFAFAVVESLHCATNRSVNDKPARLPYVRRFSSGRCTFPLGMTIQSELCWQFPCSRSFLFPSRRENPLIRCLANPYSLALPPFPSTLVVLLPRLLRRLALSSFLALPAGFFFFFGSATVPLAARESPLTRRMDDLRISSRSLSLVRSRYRRRPSASSSATVFFLRSFPTLPFFLPVRRLLHRLHAPAFHLFIAAGRPCPLCRAALWRRNHPRARSASRQINSRRHRGARCSVARLVASPLVSSDRVTRAHRVPLSYRIRCESLSTITQSVPPHRILLPHPPAFSSLFLSARTRGAPARLIARAKRFSSRARKTSRRDKYL